jgi:hypothetical protein
MKRDIGSGKLDDVLREVEQHSNWETRNAGTERRYEFLFS